MYSREESKKLRQAFWTSFGREYPRKWILYNTQIKEIQLKFTFTTRLAQVSLDVSAGDELIEEFYWEKLVALKHLLITEYLPAATFERNYELPEGKTVGRIFVELNGVNIHRKTDWPIVQDFLYEKMDDFEIFFLEFQDYLKE